MEIIKINFKRESKITKIPTAANIFGFLVNKIIEKNNLKTDDSISKMLNDLNESSFTISDVFPKGYIYNPNINYYLNDVEEKFDTDKGILQKKYKKNKYIKKVFLEENYKYENKQHYLKIYDDEQKLKDNFIKFSHNINQHVQINTAQDSKPEPFNTVTLEIKIKEFECYLTCSEEILQILKNCEKDIISLGGGIGKGYNLFSIELVEELGKEDKKFNNETGHYISLSDYVPENIEELNYIEEGSNFKVKNKSVRPVRKLKYATEDTRYRYFYIEHGSILKFDNIEKLGNIFDYKKVKGYSPKIFGKAYMYSLIDKGGSKNE
ncbi:MAG: hypothetical protein ACK5HR_04560 [Mycoplasmatales bacterium]